VLGCGREYIYLRGGKGGLRGPGVGSSGDNFFCTKGGPVGGAIFAVVGGRRRVGDAELFGHDGGRGSGPMRPGFPPSDHFGL